MRELVRKEMEAGALGIGTSLIYPPAFYAKNRRADRVVQGRGKIPGQYISHMRSEANQLFRKRLMSFCGSRAKRTFRPSLYHIKAAGKKNWPKLDELLARIERAKKTD